MKVAIVLGTRPEIIKLAPIIRKIGSKNCSIIFTGQHYDNQMGLGFMRALDLPKPNYSLNITKSNSQLQISEIIAKLSKILIKERPVMPVKSNWLDLWEKRMSKKEIKKDAENIEIKKNFLTRIGQTINNIYPKVQFMGILKISKKDFKIMKKLFFEIKNKKIDFTSFLNLAIQKKNIKIKCIKTKSYWFEIDNIKDVNITSKLLKKNY